LLMGMFLAVSVFLTEGGRVNLDFREWKVGAKFILVGVFLQLLSFVFVSGYNSHVPALGNLKRMELVFKNGYSDKDRAEDIMLATPAPFILPPPSPVAAPPSKTPKVYADNELARFDASMNEMWEKMAKENESDYAAALKEAEATLKEADIEIAQIRARPNEIRLALPYWHFYLFDISLIFWGIWLVLFGKSPRENLVP